MANNGKDYAFLNGKVRICQRSAVPLPLLIANHGFDARMHFNMNKDCHGFSSEVQINALHCVCAVRGSVK